MHLVEQPPPCPHGHTYQPEQVIAGWEPCLCTPGHTGHRTYWCREDGTVQLVPACTRRRSDSARGMGVTGPTGWPD